MPVRRGTYDIWRVKILGPKPFDKNDHAATMLATYIQAAFRQFYD